MPKRGDPGDAGFETAKRPLVRDALEPAGAQPCVVREDDDLSAATERLGASPGVNTVAIVNAEGRLVGIIPIRLLLDDLFLRVAPEEFLEDLKDATGLEKFGRMTRARTAKELMEGPAFVTMEDTAREAFSLMHARKLEGLPVVDAQMRVVAYLDRLQLLRLWLKQHGRSDWAPA